MEDRIVQLYETDDEAARAKRYSRDRLKATVVNAVWGVSGLGLFAFSGGSAGLKKRLQHTLPNGRFARPSYVAIAITGSTLLELPVAYLAGYRIERRYELSKQPLSGWLRDRAVSTAVGIALSAPILTCANEVMRRRPRSWWLWLSAASIPVSVVLSNLAPVLIMPLFNRFEPLKDDELSRQINELTERSGLSIADLFQMDMSKQSEKANAFFTGVGKTKRIVLGDTMLDRYTSEEILGVVGHEAAHQVYRDIWTLIAMGSATTLAIAWTVNKIAPKLISATAKVTEVERVDDIAAMPVLGLVAGVAGAALIPLNAAISRMIERRADRFALEATQNGVAYASTMVRLGRQNLADPNPSKLMTALIYSHPPIMDRIRRALDYERIRGNESRETSAANRQPRHEFAVN
jgi:STE24 endopeptidase